MKKVIFWIVLFLCILAMFVVYDWVITLATVLAMAIIILFIGEIYGIYTKYRANKEWKNFGKN